MQSTDSHSPSFFPPESEASLRTSLPILVWTSPSGLAGYEISRIAPRILYATPWGSAGLEEIEIYYRALMRLIDQSPEKDMILVLDYSRVVNVGPEARKIFARTMGSLRHPLGGIVFVSLNPVQRLFVGLGRRMGTYNHPVRMCRTQEDGIQAARLLALHGEVPSEPKTASPRTLSSLVDRIILRRKVNDLKAVLAQFPWDDHTAITNPFAPAHPFHDLFEMWRTIKGDIDLLDMENTQKQAALDAAIRSHADSEQLLKAVLQASESGLMGYDLDRRIRIANPATQRLLAGDHPESVVGRDWADFMHPLDRPKLIDLHRRRNLDDHLPRRYEVRIVDLDGQEHVVSLAIEPVVGSSLRIASLLELTNLRKLEQERFRKDGEIERLHARMQSHAGAGKDADAASPETIPDATAEDDELRHILLVVDDPTLHQAIREYFQALDLPAPVSSRGREAIERLETQSFDAILLDLNNGDMDGMEWIHRARANPATRRTPIIALAGHMLERDIRHGLEAGADHILVKPFLMDELVRQTRSHRRKRLQLA